MDTKKSLFQIVTSMAYATLAEVVFKRRKNLRHTNNWQFLFTAFKVEHTLFMCWTKLNFSSILSRWTPALLIAFFSVLFQILCLLAESSRHPATRQESKHSSLRTSARRVRKGQARKFRLFRIMWMHHVNIWLAANKRSWGHELFVKAPTVSWEYLLAVRPNHTLFPLSL